MSCATAPQSAGKTADFAGAVATRFRQVALVADGPRGAYLRVDTFRTIRLSAHSSSRLPSRSACRTLQARPLCPPGHEPVAGPPSALLRPTVADLALRMAPAITPTVPMATMSGPAHGRGVLLHHLGQGLDPGQETELDLTLRRTASIASASGGIGNEVARAFGLLELRIFFPMVSFSLLGLRHPEPNGSRRATPTVNCFQHRPGHLPRRRRGPPCVRRRIRRTSGRALTTIGRLMASNSDLAVEHPGVGAEGLEERAGWRRLRILTAACIEHRLQPARGNRKCASAATPSVRATDGTLGAGLQLCLDVACQLARIAAVGDDHDMLGAHTARSWSGDVVVRDPVDRVVGPRHRPAASSPRPNRRPGCRGRRQ